MKGNKELDFDWFIDFVYELACKADDTYTAKEKKGLKRFLWSSSLKLPDRLLIAFRMMTEEELANQKKQAEAKKYSEEKVADFMETRVMEFEEARATIHKKPG